MYAFFRRLKRLIVGYDIFGNVKIDMPTNLCKKSLKCDI